MDLGNIPIGWYVFFIDIHCAPCPLPESPRSRARFNCHYAIAFRHVQLAMKLSPLGGKGVHRRYLEGIMQEHTISHQRPPSFLEYYLASFAAEPRIVPDSFISKTSFHFDIGLHKISYLNVVRTALDFCPHHVIGSLPSHKDPVLVLIRSVFQQASGFALAGFQQGTFSCEVCPSNYKIVLAILENVA